MTEETTGEKPEPQKPDGPQLGQPLTRREREVLDLRAEGMTGAEVATRLFIAPRTVGYHSANAYVKLGVHTLLAAMRVLGQQTKSEQDQIPVSAEDTSAG